MKFPGGVGYGRNSFTMSDAFYLYMTFILVKQMFYLNKPYNVVIFISSSKILEQNILGWLGTKKIVGALFGTLIAWSGIIKLTHNFIN